MLIKKFTIISKKGRELDVDVEIDNIEWDNDSIGFYEYWGAKCFDRRPDYVSGFKIDEIYIRNKKIKSKLIFGWLSEYLFDNESFNEKVEDIAKGNLESEKLERQIEMQEFRRECLQDR